MSNAWASTSSYYNIDSILTDAHKVPCTFELTVPGIGYMDNHSTGNDLKQGTKVDLPLYLAEMLAVSQPASSGPLVTLDLPPALQSRVMNALNANARTVDLRSLAPHFYALGARMLELFEEEDMVDTLAECFKSRVTEIADQAHNPRGAMGEGAEFLRGLEESERKLFRVAHEGTKAVKAWQNSITR